MNIQNIMKSLAVCGYPEKQAALVAKELMEVDAKLVPLLKAWVKEGAEADFLTEGFSLLGLKSQYDMTYPAALLSINWLIKDPQIAIKAISQGIK